MKRACFCRGLKGRPGRIFLGLTGPIAGGKSAVTRRFAALGAKVISADESAARQLQPGRPAYRAVARRYGAEALLPDGQVNRRFLAAKVFAARTERVWLESVIHPAVLAEIWRFAAAARKGVVVAEIPLLFETGSQNSFDFVLCVDAPRSVRAERARSRGWSRAELLRREAAQLPQGRKAALSDIVISNDGTRASLFRKVDALYGALKAMCAAKTDCRPSGADARKKRKERSK